MNDTRLDLLCDINPETVSPVDSTEFKFRYLDISAVSRGVIDWNLTRLISFSDAPSRARRVLREGDVLLCTVRPGLQAHARISVSPLEPLVASTGFAVLRPRERGDSGFIFHQLFSDSVSRQLAAMETGSNYPAVNERDVRALKLFAPHSTERARIAAVLDAADHEIERTQAVIDKLRQVRTGLIDDLLTRGIDENGELRDPIRCPEKFQHSSCYYLPKEWIFESLGECFHRIKGTIQTGPFGSQLHAREYLTEGVPVIMPQDILEGSVNIAQIARISASRADDLNRHRVNFGDIIFARRGDLSRCAAITSREVGWLCGTGCLLMRFDNATLSPLWFSLAYRHDLAQRQVAARAVGTTMVNLNTKLLSHLRFAFPPIAEQQQIARIVAEADAEIHSELATVSKLALMKSALMSDLLTGRVLVPQDVEFS